MPRISVFNDAVLKLLSANPNGLTARRIQEEINLVQQQSNGKYCDYGNIYRILDLLKFRNHVSKRKESGAVIYRITPEGRSVLAASRRSG